MAHSVELITTLHGEDAKAVLRQIESAKYDPRKEEFLKQCDATYSRLVNNAQKRRSPRT